MKKIIKVFVAFCFCAMFFDWPVAADAQGGVFKGIQKGVGLFYKCTKKTEETTNKLSREFRKTNPRKAIPATVAASKVICPYCKGSGQEYYGGETNVCSYCNGTGRRR